MCLWQSYTRTERDCIGNTARAITVGPLQNVYWNYMSILFVAKDNKDQLQVRNFGEYNALDDKMVKSKGVSRYRDY